MKGVRQDSWAPNEDLMLAEKVLSHIRNGSTQLAAFEEAAVQLSRSAAACGFRWNAVVRKSYEGAIKLAKQQRGEPKSQKRPEAQFRLKVQVVNKGPTMPSNVDAMVRFLIEQKRKLKDLQQLERELESKTKKITLLESDIAKLEQRLEATEREYSQVNSDYRALIQIMERARKSAILLDDGEVDLTFKMDPNGNLERIV